MLIDCAHRGRTKSRCALRQTDWNKKHTHTRTLANAHPSHNLHRSDKYVYTRMMYAVRCGSARLFVCCRTNKTSEYETNGRRLRQFVFAQVRSIWLMVMLSMWCVDDDEMMATRYDEKKHSNTQQAYLRLQVRRWVCCMLDMLCIFCVRQCVLSFASKLICDHSKLQRVVIIIIGMSATAARNHSKNFWYLWWQRNWDYTCMVFITQLCDKTARNQCQVQRATRADKIGRPLYERFVVQNTTIITCIDCSCGTI